MVSKISASLFVKKISIIILHIFIYFVFVGHEEKY
jgi:hypothetical protein